MLTNEQYTTAVYTAYRANAILTQTLRAKEALGCYPKWNEASCQLLKIKSGLYSLSVGDYSSAASVDIYNQLLDIGSTWFGGISFDPYAQFPDTTIIINNGSVISALRIPFTSLTTVTLSNYQATYSTVYGNFPDISIWTDNGDGSYTQDTATVPTVINLGGDINVPDSYTWTYAIPTSGYIQLNGFITAS